MPTEQHYEAAVAWTEGTDTTPDRGEPSGGCQLRRTTVRIHPQNHPNGYRTVVHSVV